MEATAIQLKKVFGDKLRQDEPLAPYTTFKIGGPADYFINVTTVDELVTAVTEARKLNIPVFILGGGTNLLIADKGIRGLVIKNSTNKIRVVGMKGQLSAHLETHKVYVQAESGVVINQLVRFTAQEGLRGLEMHLGLPGSVGGAVYMNSKWTNPPGYVGDVVYQAEILTPDGQRKVVPQKYFQFAYDTSVIQTSRDIVLSVVFAFSRDDKDRLWSIANESISYRRQTQPQGIKSAGCTFRNVPISEVMARGLPEKATSAGFLVDHAGLKGLTIGDAQISPVHANFIINLGKATASDVVQLITKARDQVKSQFGVTLQEEIERAGEF